MASDKFVRLDKAPTLSYRAPECSGCLEELEDTGDCWTCPWCGTIWDYATSDGETGELYPSWSGEELTGPIIDGDDIMAIVARHAEIQKKSI